jgi:protein SCO1
MKLSSRQFWMIGAVVLVGLATLFAVNLKAAQGQDLTRLLGVTQKLNAEVAQDAMVVDDDGKTVPLKSFLHQGKPVVLMMIFYSCKSACITEFDASLKSFRAIQAESIGKDYTVLSLSIHPKETPELAKAKKEEYLERYNRASSGAEEGWRFLTGTEAEMQKIAKSVGIKYTYEADKDRVIHPTGLVILTPEGRVSQYMLGTEYSAPRLRESLLTAQRNGIGTEAVPILFGCFMFDPTTGQTRLNVYNAIRLVGVVTLLSFIWAVVVMVRREKSYHQIPGGGASSE